MLKRGNRKHPQRYRHPDSFMHVDLGGIAYARSDHVFDRRSIHAIKSLISMVNHMFC